MIQMFELNFKIAINMFTLLKGKKMIIMNEQREF